MNLHRHKEKGFTLVELMVCIAIIGILSTIAIQVYSNYIRRAYISHGLSLALIAKSAVVNTYASTGLPISGTAAGGLVDPINGKIGLDVSTAYASQSVESMSVYAYNSTGESHIEIGVHYKEGIFPKRSVLYLIGTIDSGSIKWQCSIQYYGSAIQAPWAPNSCNDNITIVTP